MASEALVIFGRIPVMISLPAKCFEPSSIDRELAIISIMVLMPLPSANVITVPTRVGRLLRRTCSCSENLLSNAIRIDFDVN
jgi:hypothetical protein